MDETHVASPNRETTGRVTPESQNATSTVPSQLRGQTNVTGGNASELEKIVKTAPGC